jgi:tRNA 2-thiouridine synthesizing protein A
MIDIDTRGTTCPIPVVRTMDAVKKNPGEILAVIVDGHTPRENVSRFAKSKGYSVEITQIPNGYRLLLTPKK